MFLLYHVITRLGKEGISMEQDRVRIVDVADALGLSTATVSKVISHFFPILGITFSVKYCILLYAERCLLS